MTKEKTHKAFKITFHPVFVSREAIGRLNQCAKSQLDVLSEKEETKRVKLEAKRMGWQGVDWKIPDDLLPKFSRLCSSRLENRPKLPCTNGVFIFRWWTKRRVGESCVSNGSVVSPLLFLLSASLDVHGQFGSFLLEDSHLSPHPPPSVWIRKREDTVPWQMGKGFSQSIHTYFQRTDTFFVQFQAFSILSYCQLWYRMTLPVPVPPPLVFLWVSTRWLFFFFLSF